MIRVNLQQYREKRGDFHNRSPKYTFVWYRCKYNNILMCLLFRIFPYLVFYVVTFIKALKNWTGSILIVSVISLYFLISYSLLTQLWIYSHRKSLRSDIELNPGPKRNFNQCFSVCHSNLHSVASHSFFQIQSLNAYILKFDIICLFESFLIL